MASQLASLSVWGCDFLIIVALGTSLIVVLAVIACRLIRSSAAQVAIWRTAIASIVLLLLVEATGAGPALAQFTRNAFKVSGTLRVPLSDGTRSVPDTVATTPSSPPSGNASATAASPSLPVAADAPASTAQEADGSSPPPTSAFSKVAIVPPVMAIDEPASTSNYLVWPFIAWAAGTIILLIWIAGGWLAACRFRSRCSALKDTELAARVERLKAKLLLRRRITLLDSPRVLSPLVLGGWRAALVLPTTFAADFDGPQQETILAHELAHLAARDTSWQAAASVLCALLWWHPLVWWSRRQLRAAHERLADEASLLVPDGPRVLAEALVDLGRRLLAPQPRFGLSLGGSQLEAGRFRSSLGRRVERLLSLPKNRWQAPRRARLAFVHFWLSACVALMAIVGTAWTSQAPLIQGETTMNVLTNSWRCSLVATALWAVTGSSPAPAAADDHPSSTTSSDREKALQDKFRAVRERAAQLDKDGKHEEADHLRREASEAMRRMKEGVSAGSSTTSGMTPEKQKIIEQIKALHGQIEQLEKDGKHDQADQLKKQMRELYSKVAGPRATSSAGTANEPSPERKRLYEAYKSLHDRIEAAKAAGNSDEVHHLMQEMEGLQNKLHSQEGSTTARITSDGDRGARLQHLRMAAENLRAAGANAEAQHVMEMVSRMEAEGRSDSSRTYRPEVRRDTTTNDTSRRGNPSTSGGDLRSEVEAMRREVRELREELERAKHSEGK